SEFLMSCGGDRPKGRICQIDAPNIRKICFHMDSDYDDDGNLKPGAKPHFIQYASAEEMLKDLDKDTSFDEESWASASAYRRKMKQDNQCERRLQSAN